MNRHIIFSVTILFIILGAAPSVGAQNKKQNTSVSAKKGVKFLEDIKVQASPDEDAAFGPKTVFSKSLITEKKSSGEPTTATASLSIESANPLQLKYAMLLDVEVEKALNLHLFKLIDEWFGTKYRLGGTTKEGVDCSALMQIFFMGLYGLALPRTAKEQYYFTRRISRAELKEGDLVFFNTIGGISHVGMYLQNNKFVHASANGVTISDLYENYWLKHFIGAGRIDQQATALISKP